MLRKPPVSRFLLLGQWQPDPRGQRGENMFAAVKERMDLLAEGMEDMAVDEVVPCFRIAQSNEVGRHVVTTRKVTKGEVIFR